MEELVYLNGRIVPRAQAKVSVLDYGFLFGYGLYETIRAYNGQLFRLDAHLLRMYASAKQIGIALELPELRRAVLETVKANGFLDTRVRITVSVGEGTITPNLASCQTPTVLVLAGEYHAYPAETYKRGFSAVVSSIRRNSHSPVTFMKSANSMENMLARQEARDKGADESVFLNDRNWIAEASGSNLFLVEQGVVKTPRLKSGILPGVTRTVIFELAKEMGFGVSESNLRLDRLLAADEAFLTNSLIEVMPVTSVQGKPIGDGKPGPITTQFAESYRRLVASELPAR